MVTLFSTALGIVVIGSFIALAFLFLGGARAICATMRANKIDTVLSYELDNVLSEILGCPMDAAARS